MTTVSLHQLLPSISTEIGDIALREMKLDSRKVNQGDLFVAIKGHSSDGREYIAKAIAQGAVAILAEGEPTQIEPQIIFSQERPIIYLPKLSEQLSQLAGLFYGEPSRKMHVIGVTGTNGKTTITQMIANWAELLGKKSALLGTIGNGFFNTIQPSTNTTGSAVDIQHTLNTFAEGKADLVAMEVSSHGLIQNRVTAVQFSSVIFSNLTRDHLDYHGDMAHYGQAKWLLFSSHNWKSAIINIDDPIGGQWFLKLPECRKIAVSTTDKLVETLSSLWVKAVSVKYHSAGTSIEIASSWGKGTLESHFLGLFNVSNLLLAFTTLLEQGFSFFQLLQSAPQLHSVCGRMEIFSAPRKPTIVVDYAHTPDALEKALQAIKQHVSGNVWCIFGCGGDRDKGKRPLMAAAAEKLANYIIITNDNPRTEDPSQIVNDVMSGFADASHVHVIYNRSDALKYATEYAKEGDAILLAGKGHEEYQILGSNYIDYSDRAIARAFVEGVL